MKEFAFSKTDPLSCFANQLIFIKIQEKGRNLYMHVYSEITGKKEPFFKTLLLTAFLSSAVNSGPFFKYSEKTWSLFAIFN
jgi:hypothetical protein